MARKAESGRASASPSQPTLMPEDQLDLAFLRANGRLPSQGEWLALDGSNLAQAMEGGYLPTRFLKNQ